MPHDLSDVRLLVGDMCAAVPGVTLDAVEWKEPSQQHPHPWSATVPTHTVVVTAHGWGPTLHARLRRWNIDVTGATTDVPGLPTAVRAGSLANAVRTVLRHILRDQRAMADAGAALGLTAPTPVPARVMAHDLAHLVIDTIAADAMVDRMGPRGALEDLADRLAQTIASSTGNDTQLLANAVMLASFEHGAPTIAPVVQLDAARGAAMVGSNLRVDGHMPETLLMAATGRPLGTLIETRVASLDAATILSAVNAQGMVDISLASGSTRVDRHPALSTALAATMETRR